MESCVNLTDLGLFSGINLSQLSELDLKLCTNVSGDFVFGSIGGNESKNLGLFNSLKILNFNQCIKFKEENLLKIIEKNL